MEVNPRVLYLDAVTSKFVLPVLFAILPLDLQNQEEKQEWKKYCSLRGMLTERLDIDLLPVAFSLEVNEERLGHFEDSPQMGLLRRLLDADKKDDGNLHDWKLNRLSADHFIEKTGIFAKSFFRILIRSGNR